MQGAGSSGAGVSSCMHRGAAAPSDNHLTTLPPPSPPPPQLGGDAGDPSQKGSWTKIKATTVDDFAQANDLLTASANRAVFLKIDTEGFDPAVLAGARNLLSLQVPSIILFEYHNKQAWATTSLKDVALDLASSGYVCYFDGAPKLTRITGCWHDSLEIKQWSNVVCAVMGTSYHRLLESLSFLAQGRA
jgi:hypothetical protein